jgi:hypothetical protein
MTAARNSSKAGRSIHLEPDNSCARDCQIVCAGAQLLCGWSCFRSASTRRPIDGGSGGQRVQALPGFNPAARRLRRGCRLYLPLRLGRILQTYCRRSAEVCRCEHKDRRTQALGRATCRARSDALDRAHPELATWIELELATGVPTPSPQSPGGGRRRTAINPAPVRERARALLAARNWRGHYWDDYRAPGDIEELQRLVERAVPFLEAGDGANALRILEPIAETFVEDWLDHAYETDEHL